MTPEEIKRTVDETERLWRERTPASNIVYLNASFRVSMSEIIKWGKENGIIVDRMDEDYQEASQRMFFRLMRELPDEPWGSLNSATVEFCKKRGITVPRLKKKQIENPFR